MGPGSDDDLWAWEGHLARINRNLDRPLPALPLAALGCAPEEAWEHIAGRDDSTTWGERLLAGHIGVGLGPRQVESEDEEVPALLILTFENLLVYVPVTDLERYIPEGEEGFDCVWPVLDVEPEPGGEFATEVMESLATRGYCAIQMFLSPEEGAEAEDASRSLREVVELKKELEEDYLGGNRRNTELRRLRGADESSSTPLGRLNRQVTQMGQALVPLTRPELGFEAWGSWRTAVRMAAKKGDIQTSDALADDDAEAGLIAQHLTFLRARRICFLFVIGGDGGTLRLCLKSSAEEHDVPLRQGRLILFRHSHMTFEISGANPTALQSWMMAVPDGPEIDSIMGSAAQKSHIFNISGPTMLEGKMAQAMAVGIRLSANAVGKEATWNLYTYGTDAQVQWPYSRFDEDLYYTENWTGTTQHSATNHGSFTSDSLFFGFDNKLFGIPEDEAKAMDVEQKPVLEVGYETLCLAGLCRSRASLKGQQIGVFVGDWGADIMALVTYQSMTTYDFTYTATGGRNALVPTRLQYIFGLRGATLSVDTACSSALVATHHAHMMLRETDAAGMPCKGCLSGGINVLGPSGYVGGSLGGLLTKTGRCWTFNRSADGYERGEGCAFLYLKLSGDPEDVEGRLAAMPGSATNHDGKSASLTAPNGRSQQQVLKLSMRAAQLQPDEVSAGECHGTGTALGDPIEVGAVTAVMELGRDDPFPFTSSKSNLGHNEAAAGIMGLAKAILMLRHMAASPNIHLNIINAYFSDTEFPALFETELLDLKTNSGFSGVSSFGFGGTNSRADVYTKAVEGPRRRTIPLQSRIDYIATICPKCLGRMCWRCGQAILATAPQAKHHCSLIRENLADYTFCTNCYDGEYRWGEPLRIELPDEGSTMKIFIRGTWDAWSDQVLMDHVESGDEGTARYVCAVPMGDTLREEFQLVLNNDEYQTLYPSEKRAGTSAAVCGPDGNGQGRKWLINGREDGAAAGTMYVVTLEWGEKLSVKWEMAQSSELPNACASSEHEHTYEVITDFLNDGGLWEGRKQMAPILGERGSYETTFPMNSKKLKFNFIRDNDPEQVIYPAIPDTSDEWVPIRGPDEKGFANKWLLQGIQGRTRDTVKFKLCVRKGRITLSVSSEFFRETQWESAPEDHQLYYVIGSFTRGSPKPMIPDEHDHRVHRYRIAMDSSEYYSHGPEGFFGKEEFQICLSPEDPESQALYPEFPHARREEAVVQGPDSRGTPDKTWLIVGRMFSTIDILLDFAQTDRRKVVSWMEVPASMLGPGVPRSLQSKMLTEAEIAEFHNMHKDLILDPKVQKALDRAEANAGGNPFLYKEELSKVLLKFIWPVIAAHFGFHDTYEAARWINASARFYTFTDRNRAAKCALDSIALQRDWEQWKTVKRLADGGSPFWQTPGEVPGAAKSWPVHHAVARDPSVCMAPADPEERRCDPADGRLYTWYELCQKYAGHYSSEEIVNYWRNHCTDTAVDILRPVKPKTPSQKEDLPNNIMDTEVTEFLVLQRTCIKKLGSDPTGVAMVNTKREVGSTAFTTGRVWIGKTGAQWVELDKLIEKPGWLLVEGKGFGPPGPLLSPKMPGEEQRMVLSAEVPGSEDSANAGLAAGSIRTSEEDAAEEPECRKFVLNPDATVRDAQEWIALVFGLEPSQIIIGVPGSVLKPSGGDFSNVTSLQDERTSMAEAGFKDGDRVPYCYVGDFKKGFEGKVPTWAGKLGARRKIGSTREPLKTSGPKIGSANKQQKTPELSKLTDHFKTLGLDPGAEFDVIKRQYRLLALACHPDKHRDDVEGATARFQAIKAAYEAIRDVYNF